MALEIAGDVGIGELANPYRERVGVALRGRARRARDQQQRDRRSRGSVAGGGSTRPSREPHWSGHPTRARTSDASTPGYSAASTSSPVASSTSSTALSVITLTGPAPGMPSCRRDAPPPPPPPPPAPPWPGPVVQSTRSGPARGANF